MLIADAAGGGGASYAAPNPGSGGGGTSWHTGDLGTTPVVVSFGFDTVGPSTISVLEELYMWDYYGHSPTDWTLKLYSGAGGTGTTLLDYDFSISPGTTSGTSTKHIIDFSDVTGYLSGTLETRSNSGFGGVGLSEIGFTATIFNVPEPATFTLAALGFLALLRRRRRRA